MKVASNTSSTHTILYSSIYRAANVKRIKGITNISLERRSSSSSSSKDKYHFATAPTTYPPAPAHNQGSNKLANSVPQMSLDMCSYMCSYVVRVDVQPE